MLHGVCTVAYTIFLFQREMTNFDFHTFVDYLVTKMTKQSIQIKLLSQFSNEKTQYNITWLSCKLYSLFLCKSHYVHFPHILFQNVVELLSQLNKIRISGRQFQERSTCKSNGPTSSTFKFCECDFKLVGNQDI